MGQAGQVGSLLNKAGAQGKAGNPKAPWFLVGRGKKGAGIDSALGASLRLTFALPTDPDAAAVLPQTE